MSKKFFVFLCLFLTGCGVATSSVEVGPIKISMPTGFQKTADLSESQNMSVIGSYKGIKRGNYYDSFVATTTSTSLDSNQFGQINIEKLKQKISSLTSLDTYSKTLKCGSDIAYNVFKFKILQQGDLDKPTINIYGVQGYLTYGGNGYIISYTTSDEKTANGYFSNLKSASCK